MTKFHHYQHKQLGNEVVKEGFSWPAFFFSIIWAFYMRVWVLGILGLVICAFFATLTIFSPKDFAQLAPALNVVAIVFALCFGAIGNYFRALTLERQGYQLVQEIHASSKQTASGKIE